PILWRTTLLIFLGLPVSVFLFKKITTWISKKYVPTFLNKNGQFSLPTLIFLPFAWTFFDHLEAHYSFIPAYIMTAGNTLGSSPFVGLAGLGGLIVLTFFTALISTIVAAIILNVKQISFPVSKTMFVLTALLIVVVFSGWQISNFELRQNSSEYNNLPNSINIAVVSANDDFNAG